MLPLNELTKNCDISLTLCNSFGKPGVELSAYHNTKTRIQELHFLPKQVKFERNSFR